MDEIIQNGNKMPIKPDNDYSGYVHFEIGADGKPFPVGGPGTVLDRDKLEQSTNELINKIDDGAVIDELVRQVSKAIKSSTMDLTSPSTTMSPSEKVAVALQSAPVSQKAVTGFRKDDPLSAPLGTITEDNDQPDMDNPGDEGDEK